MSDPSPADSGPKPMLLVFAPTDGACGTALDILKQWSSLDLLNDVIWLDPASDDGSGILVSRSDPREVNVADELAARNLTSIRTVSLIVVGSEDEEAACPSGSDEWNRHNRYRQLAAETRLPYSGGVLSVVTTDSVVPSKVFHAGFSFNLLVVPEDRVADDRVGAPVLPKDLPALAACALASVAGLWFWSESAVVDSIRPEGGTLDPHIRVVRAYVRVADGGNAIDRIVDSALSLNGGDGQWPLPHGPAPVPQLADDPIGMVRQVADSFISKFGLAYERRTPPGVPPPTRMTLFDGLKLFVRTMWRILRRIPVQWVEHQQIHVTEAVLRFFTARTFTESSSVILTLRGHSLPGAGAEPTGIDRQRELAALDMPGSDIITPEPQLWKAFCSVACGLADASPFPDGIDAPSRGAARLLVTAPEMIAPDSDPLLSFRYDTFDAIAISPCDAFGAAELRAMIQDALEKEHLTPPVAVPSELPPGEAAAAEPAAVPPGFAAGPIEHESNRSGSGNPTLDSSDLVGLGRVRLNELMESLDSWVNSRHRRQSFAWRIGAAIGEAVGASSEELADALTRISGGEPSIDSSEQRKEATEFSRVLRVGLLIVVVLVLGCVGTALVGVLSAVAAGIAIVVILAASFSGALARFTKFVRSQARAEFERNRQIDEYWFAFTRAYDASTALTRFSALYWQYLDWAKTAAFLLREPWGRADHRDTEDSLISSPHPLSMVVAKAEMPGDQYQRSVAAAQQSVVTPGWLRDAFDRHVTDSANRYRMLMNASDDADSDPTHDASMPGTVAGVHAASGESIFCPRSQVEADAEVRRFGASVRRQKAAEVVGLTLRNALDELFSDIDVPPPAGRGRTGDGLMEFLSYILPTESRPPSSFPGSLFTVEEVREPASIEVTLPSAVSASETAIQSATRVQGHWQARYGHPFMVGAHRVDLSTAFSVDQLQPIRRDPVTSEADLPSSSVENNGPLIP